MRRPYPWSGVDRLRNLLGLKKAERFATAEADITTVKLLIVDGAGSALLFD
jgi:hypothetical protein